MLTLLLVISTLKTLNVLSVVKFSKPLNVNVKSPVVVTPMKAGNATVTVSPL